MPPDARAHRRRCRAITQADPLVTIRYGRLELGAASPVARAPRAHARRAAFLRHQWAYSRRPWSGSAAREQLRELAAAAWIRRRFAPHELRHAQSVEIAREGVPLNVIQRQLGHADLAVTSVYLQGIDNTEVIGMIHARRAPTMPASAGLLM